MSNQGKWQFFQRSISPLLNAADEVVDDWETSGIPVRGAKELREELTKWQTK